MPGNDPLLEAEDLHRSYRKRGGRGAGQSEIAAVAGISFSLAEFETLGIVGESGSGKSTLARLLLALEKPDRGIVRFRGQPISDLPEKQVRPLRREFQAVFQDPSASLDPCLRISKIVSEPLSAHGIGRPADRSEIVNRVLQQVGLDADAALRYPSEFSGGERQRIAIARALAPKPRLVILDEPVSSLDLSVQAHILDVIAELRQKLQLSLVLISHDLEIVRGFCDRIAVMKSGKFVECGTTAEVLAKPQHRYTRLLLEAAPRPLTKR
jgi:ABC-type microcin C transport system duplicated ATPase subunit YejF